MSCESLGHGAHTVHAHGPAGRHRRPARPPRPHPLAGSGRREGLGPRRPSRLPAGPRRVLARRLRLAPPGGPAERRPPVHDRRRRPDAALPPCPLAGARRVPPGHDPRLAQLGDRVPRRGGSPDRPRGPRRRPGRRLPPGDPVAARVRAVDAVGRAGVGQPVPGVAGVRRDHGRARLRPLRRPGRRRRRRGVGDAGHGRRRAGGGRAHHRARALPVRSAGRPRRPGPGRRRAGPAVQRVPAGRARLPAPAGVPAPDPGLRPQRLPGGSAGLDRGEVRRVDRPGQAAARRGGRPGHAAGEREPHLVPGRRRLVGPHHLRGDAGVPRVRGVGGRRRLDDPAARHAHGRLRVRGRQQHPLDHRPVGRLRPLDRVRPGRPLPARSRPRTC